MKSDYIDLCMEVMQTINQNKDELDDLANKMAHTIASNKTIYFFGTGHSHMIAEEVYTRAGGIACLQAILFPELMLHQAASKSTNIERLNGYAHVIEDIVKFGKRDMLFIISNSGRNAVPIELCEIAKEKGVLTVAITSLSHSKSVTPRSGSRKLYELADIVIDNYAPIGDASITLDGFNAPMGPISTISGTTIVNYLQIRTVEYLIKMGVSAEVFKSSNVDGSQEQNKKYFEKYHEGWKEI